jgi:hypothetical protein
MFRINPRGPLITLAAALTTISSIAHADSACLKDADRYCAGIPYGEGRMLTCLQARWKDLSGACQQDIQRIQNASQQLTLACTSDVWQYCSGVVPGGDRIRVCLWARWSDLSSTCRDTLAAVAEKAQQLSDYCADDIDRLCPGIRPGGGQIYLCLKAQESKTSVWCRKALR